MQTEAEELNQSQRVGMSIVIGLFLRFYYDGCQSQNSHSVTIMGFLLIYALFETGSGRFDFNNI